MFRKGRWIEKSCKGAAHRAQNDPAAAGRAGTCLVADDYLSGKGAYNPSLLLAYRIAKVFGTSVEELYCLEENLELDEKQYREL